MITGRPNTIRTKDSLFKNWIYPHLNQTGSDLDQAVAIWEAHLQPNTVKSLLYLAKQTVKDVSGVDLDITAHVKRVGRVQQQKLPSALSQKEIVALTRACKASDPELYLPVVLASNTGMRRGEVWGLQWNDIDILKSNITVQRSYDGPTKSGKSRVIPISFALEKAILAHPNFLSYNSIGGGKRSQNIVPVIFDPNPRLKRACKEAGVREINFHSLRHSFATLALEAGRSPMLVSKCLGHSKISTTLDLYWASTGENLDLEFLPR